MTGSHAGLGIGPVGMFVRTVRAAAIRPAGTSVGEATAGPLPASIGDETMTETRTKVTPSTARRVGGGTSTCTIPQNNGGDHDSDNNGGPDDGDGCDK